MAKEPTWLDEMSRSEKLDFRERINQQDRGWILDRRGRIRRNLRIFYARGEGWYARNGNNDSSGWTRISTSEAEALACESYAQRRRDREARLAVLRTAGGI